MFDWHVLLTANFWFAARPAVIAAPFAKFMLVVFGIFLVLAIVSFFWARVKKDDRAFFRLLKKTQSLLSSMGIFGFFILFFFWQQIPYLSSRFWVLIWVIVLCIWAGFIGRFGFFEVPKQKAEVRQKEEKLKYLPPRKKK